MKHIEKRYYDYKDIRCSIKKRELEGKTIFNTYFSFGKIKHPELFDKYVLPVKEYKITETSPIRHIHNYHDLDIEMSGGVTFYEKLFNQAGECMGITIGNDYNHIWNGGETLEDVKKDLEDTVDKLLA